MNALTQHQLYELAHKLEGVGKDFFPLVPPEVNLNGTAIEDLIDQQRIVLHNLEHLLHSMRQAMPHGRDYQTSGGDKLAGIARGAWMQRQLLLETLKDELEAYALAIADQRRFSTRYVQPASVLVTGVPLRDEFTPLVEAPAVPLDEAELEKLLDDELKQVEPTDAA